MRQRIKQVQMNFKNELAMCFYSNSSFNVYSDVLNSDEYEVRLQDEVLAKGTLQDMEDFFYGCMVDNIALNAEEESDGWISLSSVDDLEKFTKTLKDYSHRWLLDISTDKLKVAPY